MHEHHMVSVRIGKLASLVVPLRWDLTEESPVLHDDQRFARNEARLQQAVPCLVDLLRSAAIHHQQSERFAIPGERRNVLIAVVWVEAARADNEPIQNALIE